MIFLSFFALAALIFVNGCTDAPNAVTCPIVTGCLEEKNAVLLAGVFNLLGCVTTSLLGGKIIDVTLSACDFGGGRGAVNALSAAMLSVVIWSATAALLGIPTSESHGIFAALAGASMSYSLKNGLPIFSGINIEAFLIVLLGLVVSTFPAYILAVIVRSVFGAKSRGSDSFFSKAQICGAAATAFVHGAQDGQKFIGIFLLLMNSVGFSQSLGDNKKTVALASVTVALIISVGTLVGSGKIVRHTGQDMVSLNKQTGFAADLSSSLVLLFCVLSGLPAGTTHSKTCGIMGAGSGLSKKIVREMLLAWILTFPACCALGFLLECLIAHS